MIPAQLGFTYVELDWQDGRVFIRARHPVLAWTPNEARYCPIVMLPVMVVPRAEESWGVIYPDGKVVSMDGELYESIGAWLAYEREAEEYSQKLQAAEKAKETAP